MCKFKVGDKIRPNNLAESAYPITVGGWRGVVFSIKDKEYFEAKSIKYRKDERYFLNDKYFELDKADTPEEAFWRSALS